MNDQQPPENPDGLVFALRLAWARRQLAITEWWVNVTGRNKRSEPL